MSDKFIVYAHISPEGKVYVGMTSKSLEVRSGYRGHNYLSNVEFYADITKFGWDSFKHLILLDNLSESSAKKYESYYIQKFNACNPDHGYNKTLGGEFHEPSELTRKRISESSKKLWKDDNFRYSVIQGNRKAKLGTSLSNDHKAKISNGMKRYYSNHESKRKGTHLTDEQKARLRGRKSWNKGLSKETDMRVNAISDSLKGRNFSESTRLAMSNSRKSKFKNGYKPVWINNGTAEAYIDLSKSEIPSGFKVGRLKRNRVLVTNEVISKYVNKEEVSEYLSNGWHLGFSKERKQSLSNKAQTFVYFYKDKSFNKAGDLAEYLRNNGYPKIVSSTITSLLRNGPSKNSIYKQLYNEISRKPKHEN